MATGSGVLLGFGRGVGLPGADPQPSSTVASLSCTESPSCVFSDSLRSGSRDCSPSLCVCLTSMGFCVHLFTFKNKTKQNRVSVCSPPWSGICSPPASASQALQSLRPVHAPFPPTHTPPAPALPSFSFLYRSELLCSPPTVEPSSLFELCWCCSESLCSYSCQCQIN